MHPKQKPSGERYKVLDTRISCPVISEIRKLVHQIEADAAFAIAMTVEIGDYINHLWHVWRSFRKRPLLTAAQKRFGLLIRLAVIWTGSPRSNLEMLGHPKTFSLTS